MIRLRYKERMEGTTMIDTELMAKVRAIIEQHPSRHRQSSWVGNVFTYMFGNGKPRAAEELAGFATTDMPDEPADPENPVCGTTACVAGWAAILAAPKGATIINMFDIAIPARKITGRMAYDYRSIPTYAQEKLGLTDDQATWLFSGYRKREEILAAMAWLPDHQDASRKASRKALEVFEIPGDEDEDD
jgi:hypothetical protein